MESFRRPNCHKSSKNGRFEPECNHRRRAENGFCSTENHFLLAETSNPSTENNFLRAENVSRSTENDFLLAEISNPSTENDFLLAEFVSRSTENDFLSNENRPRWQLNKTTRSTRTPTPLPEGEGLRSEFAITEGTPTSHRQESMHERDGHRASADALNEA